MKVYNQKFEYHGIERERDLPSWFLTMSEFNYDWWKSPMSGRSNFWKNKIVSANDCHNLHIFYSHHLKCVCVCVVVEMVEVNRGFVEIECCQFTWIFFTHCLYPKFKLIGLIKATLHKICNIEAKKQRCLLNVAWSPLLHGFCLVS